MVRFRCLSIMSVLLLLLQILLAPAAALGSDTEFNGRNAYNHTEYLAIRIGPRPPGSQQESLAGVYIAQKFREYDWKVTIQEFSRMNALDNGSLKKYSLVNSRNIIAVRQGKSPDKVVIGAHYDSADFNVPGAGDNASGVGVLLELARVLGQQTGDTGFILVAFGAEEAGLVGSRYFTENYDLSQAKLMVNLDMVGEGNRVALDGGGKVSTPPALLQAAYLAAKGQGLKPEVRRDFMLLARDSKEGGTSDFSPFLDKWIPAIGLGQGGRPPVHYHQPTDTMEHIDENSLGAYGRLVLSLVSQAAKFKMSGEWNDTYLTVDLGTVLLVFGLTSIKLFVVGSLMFAGFWLVIKRRQIWFSLGWLVPGVWLITSLVILAGFFPAFLISLLKRVNEPWFAHPGFYVVLQVCVSIILLYFVSQFGHQLPRKMLPREPEVYWAGSVILLAGGTLIIASQRWDFALYLAFWLLLATLSRFGRGFVFAFLGPLLIYSLHWQLLNSHLWSEFYRTFLNHPVLFAIIYGFGLLPLVLSLLACAAERHRPWPRLTAKVAAAVILYITVSVTFSPAYSNAQPQQLLVREEWQGHKLTLKASGKDKVPEAITKTVGLKERAKEISFPLPGGTEPMKAGIKIQEVKLGKERLVTVDVNMDYLDSPGLLKLILRSESPFTLVSGGDFFPLGKLARNLKLNGEPTGGVYGLVLERTPPQPRQFQLYLKAEGQVRLTLEAQYPAQFVEKKFSVPKTVIKYENWVVYRKDI